MRVRFLVPLLFVGCSEPAPPPPVVPEAKPPEPVAEVSAASAAPEPPKAPPPPPEPAVAFAQVERTSSPERMPKLAIVAPAKNQVLSLAKAKDLAVKLTLASWDLGAAGDVCVAIDKHPCVAFTDLKNAPTLGKLDATLDEGQHVISAFLRRRSFESVKPQGKASAFASHSFFVGKRVPPVWKDGGPMVFASVPREGAAPGDGLLVDAYVANLELAEGKATLHVAITGPGLEQGLGLSTAQLAPFRLTNARPGEYEVKFSLHKFDAALGPSASSTTVSYSSKPVGGPFGEVVRRFRVTK